MKSGAEPALRTHERTATGRSAKKDAVIYFRFPVEAVIFLRLLQLYNKLAGSNFCLGNGSYVD